MNSVGPKRCRSLASIYLQIKAKKMIKIETEIMARRPPCTSDDRSQPKQQEKVKQTKQKRLPQLTHFCFPNWLRTRTCFRHSEFANFLRSSCAAVAGVLTLILTTFRNDLNTSLCHCCNTFGASDTETHERPSEAILTE